MAVCKFDCDVRILPKIKDGFNGKQKDYFLIENEQPKINNPEFLLKNIFRHFSNKAKMLDTFKKLEEEIIHFKRIQISENKSRV